MQRLNGNVGTLAHSVETSDSPGLDQPYLPQAMADPELQSSTVKRDTFLEGFVQGIIDSIVAN